MQTATFAKHWTLTFQDEFDGPAGDAPCASRWSRDLGGGGFGNNELQTYTDGSSNAFLDGEGNLVVEARAESLTGADGITRCYTSARLKTQGKFSQTHGKFEARMKLPRGQGIWPALWMLGDSIDTIGWPECGEIDIMESIGPVATTLYGTLHGPGYCGGDNVQRTIELAETMADSFHVYGIEWEPGEIRWCLDGECYGTIRQEEVPGGRWPFDAPFFILMNLAIGGLWPGEPDSTTTFPQRLVVDYVRVWAQTSATPIE